MWSARLARFLSDAEIGFMDPRLLSTFHVEKDVTETVLLVRIGIFNFDGFDVTLMSGGKVALADATPQIRTVVFRSFS